MKAVVFDHHGGPEVLQYTDVPKPEIKANEVLIEVRACALNHLDIWVRGGLPGITIPLPHTLGNDVAGVVSATGELVTWVKPGEEVIVQPGVSCGHCRACLDGRDNMCPEYDIVGYRRNGGYAQFVAVPGVNIVPKPKSLAWEEAAALPLVTITAWHMLVTRAKVQPGENVLVHAAGSGVGSIGIQVAKLLGARVITTAGSAEKLAKYMEKAKAELKRARMVLLDGVPIHAEPRNETDVAAILWKLEGAGALPFHEFRTLRYAGASKGIDLLVTIRETPEAERFETVFAEVENRFLSFYKHGHNLAQTRIVFCWEYDRAGFPDADVHLAAEGKQWKILVRVGEHQLTVYRISRFPRLSLEAEKDKTEGV